VVRQPDQPGRIPFEHVLRDRDHLDPRVQLAQPARRALHARRADPGVGHQQLPVQVGGLDVAIVGQNQPPNPGSG